MLGPFAEQRTRHYVLAVGQCLLFAALCAPLGAQDSVVSVPDAPACATCSLDVSAIVELGDREGPGTVGEQAYIRRSDDGDYYVSANLGDGRLLRFSPGGIFRDAIGRRGEGPGEYILPVLMGGTADSLTILDIRSFRLTTIRDNATATTSLLFIAGDFALLPDGRHVYSAVVFEPDRIGHPLHLYDEASGEITRSFGDEGVRVDRSSRSSSALRRRVAVAEDANIWAARSNRYRIDKWSADGDRIVRIERDAAWFRPWEEWPGVEYEVRPFPAIVGVRDWGNNMLMVVVRVADAEWKPIRPTRALLPGHESTMPGQQHELYDTVIEVLDTRLGTVVARTQVDVRVAGLVGRHGFYSYAEHSELGEPKFIVWSVELVGYSR